MASSTSTTGPATKSAELDRLYEHSICGVTPFLDRGYDAVDNTLRDAFAILEVIEATCLDDHFARLPSDLQARAVRSAQRLVALAHFHATMEFERS
jgi:hypothetical protein